MVTLKDIDIYIYIWNIEIYYIYIHVILYTSIYITYVNTICFTCHQGSFQSSTGDLFIHLCPGNIQCSTSGASRTQRRGANLWRALSGCATICVGKSGQSNELSSSGPWHVVLWEHFPFPRALSGRCCGKGGELENDWWPLNFWNWPQHTTLTTIAQRFQKFLVGWEDPTNQDIYYSSGVTPLVDRGLFCFSSNKSSNSSKKQQQLWEP